MTSHETPATVGSEAPEAPPEPAETPEDRLWTVADVARFLARSERWVWDALAVDPAKPGSLPYVRIPGGRGCRNGRGAPRFLPEHVRAWVTSGCPPRSVFETWQAKRPGRKASEKKKDS